MVDKKGAWIAGLICHFGCLIKYLLPVMCLLQCLKIQRISHDDASGGMAREKGLKCALGIFGWTLVPKLQANSFLTYLYDFEREITVGIQNCVLAVFSGLIVKFQKTLD
jgi:hypothetical protein